MIKPAQCRGARGLLKWSQKDLASESEITSVTIRNFENEKTMPQKGTLVVLKLTLEAAGIEFIPENGAGVGVRLKK
ncbi:helix-turn-helix domain-containing protein [Paremcibacter congregatus]|uniref:Transcriptional regulator n=1 Tax=Paremcibacter congregatus TaxID=2043170 RepID=A0A2G4YWN6_9PROT|nr:helix-turn-helix domain-containing protein [Paremcibacter congregatus]PHZ86673.1 transcriptional regulator [Paremcibacter congregatus]QDE29152.1 helix-turn-helix transcriptional regulator [Paremcibacter congregatus]